ncbi:hypothetical protein JKP88DRAFT_251073 [Tribonema minus]|uniref:Secreted protein n=1 Tax=Tribonema minus TaxID=303371 RepID=A0A835ZH61_9STRA|nr:hypothetical protein JKP88DRAFT_251073 [Tribonema minus]
MASFNCVDILCAWRPVLLLLLRALHVRARRASGFARDRSGSSTRLRLRALCVSEQAFAACRPRAAYTTPPAVSTQRNTQLVSRQAAICRPGKASLMNFQAARRKCLLYAHVHATHNGSDVKHACGFIFILKVMLKCITSCLMPILHCGSPSAPPPPPPLLFMEHGASLLLQLLSFFATPAAQHSQ